MTNPTYLDQARAGDWGHEYACIDIGNPCLLCGYVFGSESLKLHVCPVRIARFADIKAHEKAIAEIERLAKERCEGCTQGMPLEYAGEGRPMVHRIGKYGVANCLAQPEQRRLAELQKELEALKGASK